MADAKYQRGKIYKITAPDTDSLYIGSTTKTLEVRFSSHKTDYARFIAGVNHRVGSFELLAREGAVIELIEDFPCENRKQLIAREQHYINENRANVTNHHNAAILDRVADKYRRNHTAFAKQQRKDNKLIWDARRYNCVCGANIKNSSRFCHYRTAKHRAYLPAH